MKTFLPARLLLPAAVALAPIPAVAQTDAASATAPAEQGVLTGRVLNSATGSYLRDAQVTDVATNRSVLTETDGGFQLNLPAGQRRIRISYFGLDDREITFEIAAGQRRNEEIALTDPDYGEVIALEAFVVAGEKEGRAAALSRQKEAENMVTLISSDEFANVAGGSVGDFLRNVPGFSIEYSGDDPRSISVRGQDPNMNTVTVNGMRSANAASGNANRQFELDQISLQDVESVEIFKAPPASMDADSGGGTVNMTSKSAFTTKGRRITYSILGNGKSSAFTLNKKRMPDDQPILKIRPGATLSYTESFFGNRLGVAITGNFNEFYTDGVSISKNYGLTSTRSGFSDTDVNSPRGIYPRTFSYGLSPNITNRQALSVNLDFKLSENTTIWTRNQVNTSLIYGGARSLELGVIAPNSTDVDGSNSMATDWTAEQWTAIGADPGAEQLSGNYARLNGEYLYKTGTGTTFSIGADHKFGDWKINYAASTSLSTNHYDNQGDMPVPQVELFLRGIGYTVDASQSGNYPYFVQNSGPSVYDLSNYTSNAGTAATTRVSGARVRYKLDDAGNTILLNRDTSIYPIASPSGTLVYDFPMSFDGNGVGSITKSAGSFSNTGNRAVLTYPDVYTANMDASPFRLRNGRRSNAKESFNTAKLDVRRNFRTSIPFYLQAGAQFRQQNRDMDKWGQTRWYYTGDAADQAAFAAAAAATAANDPTASAQRIAADAAYRTKLAGHLSTLGNDKLPQPSAYQVPYYNLDAVNAFFKANPNLFTEDTAWRIETELAGFKSVEEKVSAGYAMGNFRFGRLNVLAGVRYELTEGKGTGPVVDNEAARDAALNQLLAHVQSRGYATINDAYHATLAPMADYHTATMLSDFRADPVELARIRYARRQTVQQDYDDFFPNLQLKYTVAPNVVVRGSYNRTIGRQNFENIIPGYTVTPPGNEDSALIVTANNPQLKPVYFDNLEVSIEKYLRPSGLISVNGYYKDVKNYVFQTDETILPGVDYGYDLSGYVGETLRHLVNAGEGRIWGVEASYSQHLSAISQVLRPFSVFANYTYQKGEASASYDGSATSKTLPILRFVPKMFNAGVTFREGPYNLSVKYNWKDAYASGVTLDGVNGQAMLTYFDQRGTLDFSAAYTFYKRHSLFLEVKNLTNEPVRQYIVNKDWMRTYNLYGATIYLGFKGTF